MGWKKKVNKKISVSDNPLSLTQDSLLHWPREERERKKKTYNDLLWNKS